MIKVQLTTPVIGEAHRITLPVLLVSHPKTRMTVLYATAERRLTPPEAMHRLSMKQDVVTTAMHSRADTRDPLLQ